MFIFILIVLIFSSCRDSKEVNFNVYDSVLKDKSCQLEKVGEIFIKEGGDKFLGSISSGRVKFKHIFLRDIIKRDAVVVLNLRGEIVKYIGRRGGGPGEIKEVMDFDVGDDGLIYIFDMGNMRFSIFDTSGAFIKTFKLKSNGNLSGPSGNVRVNKGKIYAGIFESKFFNEYEVYKSKRIAVIDTQGNVLHLFGYADEIFRKFKLYYALFSVKFSFDKFGNIYMAQGGVYRIHKYNSDYKLEKVFGHLGRFKLVNQDIPWDLPIPKKAELVQKFSDTGSIHVVDSLVFYQFVNLTAEGIYKRELLYFRYYLKVYDLDGNYIPSDIELPGRMLDVDEDGNIYIYESNEPGKRRIGVYRLRIRDN